MLQTWRDWKSNLLKRVATYKSYTMGTGGGQPKSLYTSPSEDDLLEFLTPEASGMSDIPEGGAISNHSFLEDCLTAKNNFSPSLPNFTSTQQTGKNILMSQKLQDPSIRQTTKELTSLKNTSCSQRLQNATSSWQDPFFSDVINVDAEDLPINVSDDI